MKIKIILFLLIVLKTLSINAQEPLFEWGHSFGGSDFDSAQKVVVDNADNVISTGYFHDTVDFDPSSNINNITAVDGDEIFIQKLNSDGELVWIKSIGGLRHDVGRSLVTDSDNNIFVTGYFNDTVDFDPNSGVVNLTANGTYDDIFVLKLNANGDFLWVKQVGGASFEEGIAITLDINDNVYTTGHFSGTIDFDPGPGTHLLASGGIFVQKLDNNGNFIWAKNMTGGTGFTRGKTISTDSNNNIYVGGDFQSTVDFDPGSATNNLTATGIDAFIVKLNSNGQFLWAKQIGGDHSDILTELTVDYNDNLYTTGYFYQSADFDPGPGVVNLTNDFYPDIYVLKLNSDGVFLWVKQFGSAGENKGEGVATDLIGNVFVTGTFARTTDFDPGTNTSNLTPTGYSDSFILKLDINGDFVWAQQVAGNNSTVGKSIAIVSNTDGNDILVTGAHRATIDIDPTTGVSNFTSNGFNDFFLLKLFDPLPLCTNLSSPLDGATDVSVSSDIEWAAIANATGYYISIGTTSGGTEIVNREDVGNVTTYNPLTDFAENQYIYVTITPYNCVGEATACSEESFLTESTTVPFCTSLSVPLNGATNVSVSTTIDWIAITNATGYYLSIGTTSGGTEIANREDVGNVTTYNPLIDFAENQYIYVTVIPYNSIGEAAACSEESFLTETIISAPLCTSLNSPLNGATNISVSSNIDWASIANATGYYLSIGTTSGGTEIVNREDVGNVTTYNPTTDFAENQNIYVTVIPYNSVGEATTCSEESFLTETIVLAPSCTNLSTPLNGATNVSISSNIDWTAIANATSYYISIGITPGGTEITNREDVGNVTTYNPTTDFAENQNIYVTVIPYNSVGEATGCSEENFLTENEGLVIPKFFTPNNDDFNDYWQIEGLLTDRTIYIFDRYGKLLKQLSTNSNGWDGTYNGQPMPSNDYWFKVSLDNGLIISRSFTLKR